MADNLLEEKIVGILESLVEKQDHLINKQDQTDAYLLAMSRDMKEGFQQISRDIRDLKADVGDLRQGQQATNSLLAGQMAQLGATNATLSQTNTRLEKVERTLSYTCD